MKVFTVRFDPETRPQTAAAPLQISQLADQHTVAESDILVDIDGSLRRVGPRISFDPRAFAAARPRAPRSRSARTTPPRIRSSSACRS